MPGTASFFMRKAGTQKSCSTSLDWSVNLTCRSIGTCSCGEATSLPSLLVEERPGELLADDAHVERVGVGRLDVLEHDERVGAQADQHDRRDRGPDDLQARVAVDRRPVEVLLARAHPELEHREQDDHRDPDEHGDREDDQDVPQRVDLLRLFGGRDGEPVDQQAGGDAERGGDDADADHLLPVGASMRTLGPRPGALSPLLKAHGAGILCERADERSVSEETTTQAARYAGRALNCVPGGAHAGARPLARKSDGATPW